MFGRTAFVRVLVHAAVLYALSGCARETQVSSGNREGVFHFAHDAEPSDLDPNTNISGDTGMILGALFEGLVCTGSDGLTIHPGVAERWEISTDQKTYTFHLRADARWSNGAPVTSEDFLFSFRRIFDPVLGCENSSEGFCVEGAEDMVRGRLKDPAMLGFEARDPRTFVIHLLHPAPFFLTILGSAPFMPLYRPLLEKFDAIHQRGGAWTRQGNFIGNGPFRLKTWRQDQVIVADRNPFYWDAAHVNLREIRFYPIEDEAVQEHGFRSGQFHMTTRFPASKEPAYRAGEPPVLRVAPALMVVFLTFNVAKAPYSDPRFRRALSLAIDREKLVSAVFGRFAEPAHSLVRPGTGGYVPAGYPSAKYDPVEARRLLASAGFPDGKGCPAVDLMLVGKDSQTMLEGEVIQSAWQNELGLHVQLSPTEVKVYLDAERSKHYQIMVDRWGSSWDDPTAVLQTAQSGNPNNDSGWSDPDFDEAYAATDRAPTPSARKMAFDRQEARLGESLPYAPLYYKNQPSLVSPSVRGWRENPVGAIDWKEIRLVQQSF